MSTASQPTVVISFKDGSMLAGGSRPTSILAPRCRKGAIHPSNTQREIRWSRDWQVGWLFTSKNARDVNAGLPVQIADLWSIADKATPSREGGGGHHRWEPMLRS
jgi:hypothetical protein